MTTIDDSLDLVVRDLEAGQWAAARAGAERLLEAYPEEPRALQCLGLAHYFAGSLPEAVRCLRQAAALVPDDGDCQARLGMVLQESLDYAGAITAHERALALAPDDPSAWNNLGLCHWNLGRSDRALEAYGKALSNAPRFPEANFNKGLAHAGRAELDLARGALERTLELQPDRAEAHLYLAAVLSEAGQEQQAAAQLEAFRAERGTGHWLADSWEYARRHRGPETGVLFDGPGTVLQAALNRAQVDGLVAEFGVAHGNTINTIARHAGQPVHGFDAFEGLPERWGDLPAGAYSLDGLLPDVLDNVELHVGWFEDTVPGFLEQEPGALRLANVDCDLYGSTRTVFQALGERVRPGSVFVFDEYFMGEDWRKHEYRAFQEAVEAFGWAYEYRALSILTRQTVIEVTAVNH
ncbi:MAG: tetratricopeptide repeat protein [Pseudomonadota bacterium]